MQQKHKHTSPTILVILGATGDLMEKKIIPALFALHMDGKLPKDFKVIGVARKKYTNGAFRVYVARELKKHFKTVGKRKIDSFIQYFSYHQGNFTHKTTWKKLSSKLEECDLEWGVCSNKCYYLAVMPDYFDDIFARMAEVNLNIPCGGNLGWTRILIEKPFGTDLASAKKLEKLLRTYFTPEQLYLIDHYTAKHTLQNILPLRRSSQLLAQQWDYRGIERIDIRLNEKVSVGERGHFYDPIGALRDVGQNHLLQMLVAVTMQLPVDNVAEELHAKRAEIIQSLQHWTHSLITKNTFRAQYAGYPDTAGVTKSSQTETYFKIQTELMHPAWKGVLIALEAGKNLGQDQKEIVMTFRSKSERHKDQIVFSIAPKEEIRLILHIEVDGQIKKHTTRIPIHSKHSALPYAEEYAALLSRAFAGEREYFISLKEIEAAWRWTDPITKAWGKNAVPLEPYRPGHLPMARLESPQSLTSGSITIIGLGKMGGNIARHLLQKDWSVLGYNRTFEKTIEFKQFGLKPLEHLGEIMRESSHPRIVWLMVPAGRAVDQVIFGRQGLRSLLKRDDIIIDGGNSYYKDTVRRARKLKGAGIHYIDVGFSGGPEGALHGASLMVGGELKVIERLNSLWHDLAVPGGYTYCGESGAGHFAKMIHNGIEYGMMQSLAEGFTILKSSRYDLDLRNLARVYSNGSVIESRLTQWLEQALYFNGNDLSEISGKVARTGEGDWTVKTANAMHIKAEVIKKALRFRIDSQKNPGYTGKILSALREQFGGHSVRTK